MQILEGHIGHVLSLAYSPDGQTLASGDAYNLLKLWDPATGDERATLRGRRPAGSRLGLTGLAFHPNGTTLAAVGGRRDVTLWNPVEGRQRSTRALHEVPARSVAFMPDGTPVSVGHASYSNADLIVWQPDWSRPRQHHVFDFGIHELSIAPDGQTVALAMQYGLGICSPWVASSDAIDRSFVDVAREKGRAELPLLHLIHQEYDVMAVAFSPDGTTLASASWYSVHLWDTRDYQLLATLEGHNEPVQAIAFSPDGLTVASGSQDGTLRLWDVIDHRERDCLDPEDGWINALAFAPDGMTLAIGCEEDIMIWDVPP